MVESQKEYGIQRILFGMTNNNIENGCNRNFQGQPAGQLLLPSLLMNVYCTLNKIAVCLRPQRYLDSWRYS